MFPGGIGNVRTKRAAVRGCWLFGMLDGDRAGFAKWGTRADAHSGCAVSGATACSATHARPDSRRIDGSAFRAAAEFLTWHRSGEPAAAELARAEYAAAHSLNPGHDCELFHPQ